MPHYNTSCTKCGVKLHHKQVAFEKEIKLQLRSALVAKPKHYTMRFCTSCLAECFNQTLDMLPLTDYGRFVTRYSDSKESDTCICKSK